MVLNWLAERPRPLVRDELVSARLGDLRDAVERLFDEHDAEAIVPLASRDELTGLLVIGGLAGGRALRPAEIAWLGSMRERAAQALLYATMYRQTHARVEVAKEIELAAAVQEAFVPAPTPKDYGPLRLCGLYAPATRCGGDWWAAHVLSGGRARPRKADGPRRLCGLYAPATRCGGDWWSAHVLSGGRALVLVGDVTGHGVAAAMVTAAAKGCYDVALRLMGDGVDLAGLMEE